jgi:ATP-dependent Clp protease adaptor protein ClpS
VLVLAFVSVLSAFCLVSGYRLVLNRPNRQGMLLSPTGWRVTAACFLVLAAVLGVVAIRDAEYALAFPSGVAILFAYACVMAARGKDIEPAALTPAPLPASPIFPAETSLLQIEGFARPGFQHGVQILNDDRTPMEFAVQVLEKSLRLHRVEATRMMLEIHNKGGVLVATVSVEESRRVAEEVSEAARVGGHPLACRAVSVESPG